MPRTCNGGFLLTTTSLTTGGSLHCLPSAKAWIRSRYTDAAFELYFAAISVSLAIPYCARKLLSVSLPPDSIFLIWISDHESMVTDLTKEMWTPSPRCFPEHSRHMKIPYETEAHCGFFCAQSTHTLFSGWDWRARSCLAAAMILRSSEHPEQI